MRYFSSSGMVSPAKSLRDVTMVSKFSEEYEETTGSPNISTYRLYTTSYESGITVPGIATAAGLYYFSLERTDDFQNFATIHAGVNPNDKLDSYWVNIGNYDNTALYNEQKNIDRNWGARYDSPTYQWQWDNAGNRKAYDNIRIDAANLETLSYYTIGAVLANHLLSAMNASFQAGSLNVEVNPEISGGANPEGKLAVSWFLP